MKDVQEGKTINEFVGLKSKMYSMKNIDDKETNAAKGVNIATEFNEFKDTLLNKKILRHKMRRIQSKRHKLGTYEINKKSLSCFDDKRSVSNDGIHTRAYFHKELSRETIKTILSLFIFFYEKISLAQKAPKCKTSDFHPLRRLCAQKIVVALVIFCLLILMFLLVHFCL